MTSSDMYSVIQSLNIYTSIKTARPRHRGSKPPTAWTQPSSRQKLSQSLPT